MSDTDFLIIGGGIAGVSLAAALSRHGTVTLLEREAALGTQASGRSAAMYEPSYGSAPVRALNQASRAGMLEAEVLSPRGIMLIGALGDPEGFERDLTEMHMERLSIDEATERVPILNPDTIHGVGFSDAAQDIDTDKLLQHFARIARGNGVLHSNAVATKITHERQGWRVETPQGAFAGRVLVNAAGAWADEVAALAGARPLGLQPYRRSMGRIPAPGGHDLRAWPMIFGAGECWYAKPDAGKLIVSPAEEDPMPPHDAWADDMVLAEGIARYEAHVTEPVTRLETSWAGLRTFAPDRALVIGFDPDLPDFFWQAGQGGYGFQTAPGAAAHAASLIASAPPVLEPEIEKALSPSRFG